MEDAIRGLTEAIEKAAAGQHDILDFVAIFISLAAIIVSVYGIYVQRKLNNVNLQSTYFKEIFGEYLKKKIPESSSKLVYDEHGKLDKSYREISKVLFTMWRSCGYFKYVHNDFYFQLGEMIKTIDEALVTIAGIREPEKEKQSKNIIAIHQKIEEIVLFINKEFLRY